jgi:hypothetical protein
LADSGVKKTEVDAGAEVFSIVANKEVAAREACCWWAGAKALQDARVARAMAVVAVEKRMFEIIIIVVVV